MCLDNLKINQKSYYNLNNSAFEADFLWKVSLKILNSRSSQPQNPEFRINPENFHSWQLHAQSVQELKLDSSKY